MIIFAVSMVVLAVLTVLMNATRTGKALRAVAEDRSPRACSGSIRTGSSC